MSKNRLDNSFLLTEKGNEYKWLGNLKSEGVVMSLWVIEPYPNEEQFFVQLFSAGIRAQGVSFEKMFVAKDKPLIIFQDGEPTFLLLNEGSPQECAENWGKRKGGRGVYELKILH